MGGMAETVNTLIHRVRVFAVFTGSYFHLFHIHSQISGTWTFLPCCQRCSCLTENSETVDLPGIGKNSQRAYLSTFKRLCTQYNKNVNIRLCTKNFRYPNLIVRVVRVCIAVKSRLLKDLPVTVSFPGKCCYKIHILWWGEQSDKNKKPEFKLHHKIIVLFFC